jgi:hypothetical protein
MYASSKGTIKLADMRQRALCDQHHKGTRSHFLCSLYLLWTNQLTHLNLQCSLRTRGRCLFSFLLLRNYILDIRRKVFSRWPVYCIKRLLDCQDLGREHGATAIEDNSHPRTSSTPPMRHI